MVDLELCKFLNKEDAGLWNFDIDDNDNEKSIPDGDTEQDVHQWLEHLEEMDFSSNEDQE